jgi:hypothetical protein
MKELTAAEVGPIWDEVRGEAHSSWNAAQSCCGSALVRFANELLGRWSPRIGEFVVRGGCSASEARERERIAFMQGAHAGVPALTDSSLARECNNRYPSLLPAKAGPIELHSGQWTYLPGEPVNPWVLNDLARYSTPACHTAEEFEKCAALLRGLMS